MTSTQVADQASTRAAPSLRAKLNGPWHERALQGFMVVVLAHWVEHIAQAYQVYVLKWPPHMAGGALGQLFPWLVHSEVMHYGYALIMLVGLWTLLPGFVGRSHTWWLVALVIQFWHHIEHLLLLVQASLGHNLFGRPVPTSILQLVFPRLELHLFYNTIVFIPMVVAMVYHLWPSAPEAAQMQCSCARPSHAARA